jgi:LacI family transcriptional regulator
MIKSRFQCRSHLIDNGYRKIAQLRPLNPQNAIDHFIGYKKSPRKKQHYF